MSECGGCEGGGGGFKIGKMMDMSDGLMDACIKQNLDIYGIEMKR